jgi:D-alanyl-D-alanine dipeptidase
MITVGAQANGQAVGEDATAFSKWNKGLIDRIIPEKNDTKKSVEEEKPEEEKPDYEDTIEEYEDFVDSMETQKFTDSIDSFKSVLKNFLTYIQGQQSQKEEKASGTVGFIPVSLNLDIVGLSGMKILQKFTINQKFLPYNYPESIEFLVKGLSQKVDNNGWTTSIESLSIPKDISAGANPPLPASQNTFTSTDEGTNTGTVPQNSTNAAGGTPKKTSGAKYSVKNIPATQDLCAAVSGEIKGPIVKSKIINAYKSNVKGKKEFIDKLEKAYDALVKQGIKLDIGDSYRSYDVQRQAYITNEAARAAGKKVDNKAHPCKGYHVLGQALDLNQTASQKKDIQSHGKIYKALYDAGLRRIGNEWWHWSIGEATHTINQQFTDHGGDIKNYNRY